MNSLPQAPDLSALPRLADPVPDPKHKPQLQELTSDHMKAVVDVRQRLEKGLRTPKVGIVCGSGLQGLAELLQDRQEVNYADIEGFGESTVRGHQSALAFGYLGEKRVPVVCQLGRFHAYEGLSSSAIIYPMRIMKLLGIQAVVITNAAGGLNNKMRVGDVVALVDHLGLPSMTSMNPLIGPNQDTLGPRFPPMSDAYDYNLRLSAFRAAHALKWDKDILREGIYAWVAGPTYETRAEQRFLQAAGADVVGMSTVPEVIAARHLGIRVLVLSLITNMVVATPYKYAGKAFEEELTGRSASKEVEVEKEEVANHQEVLDVSAKRADDIRALVAKIVDLEF